ncbi:MAG: hypothetical protein Q8Q09_03245 [Deltaproteobacteria bacterium]|nr:hypothetical protein [Deltaproteobacteria bacterium]
MSLFAARASTYPATLTDRCCTAHIAKTASAALGEVSSVSTSAAQE